MSSFSQTTSTPRLLNDSLVILSLPQLKKTNLIFLEHRKLKSVNSILTEQNKHLFNLNKEYVKIDSVQKCNLENYSRLVLKKDEELLKISDDLKIQKNKNKVKNYIIGGSITVTVLLILISTLK
jgi:hypothetical protein